MGEFDVFKEAADDIRVQPSRGAWKRVESKLEAHNARRSLLHSRVIGYAAAVMLLVLGSATVLYLVMQPRFEASSTYSQSIVDLTISDGGEDSIFDPEKIKDLTRRIGHPQ